MINPGGTSSVVHSKSAVTRMNNNLVNAARASMPFNAAAQASLRHQSSAPKNPGPPVGTPIIPQVPVENSVSLPTGGPQLPPQATADFDPEVFKDDILNTVIGEVRTEQFLNSPQVKDAVTSVRLKNVFNSGNPRKTPDSRTLFEQVVSRMGIK